MSKSNDTPPLISLSEPRRNQWQELLLQVGDSTDNLLDRLKHNFNRRFRPDEPLQIVAFRGFANDEYAFFMGRVVEYKAPPATNADSLWNTILTSYQRFESDEVPGIRVQASIDAVHYQTQTDKEGYYTFQVPVDQINAGPFDVTISLPDDSERCSNVVTAITRPAADASFGVISDIDDTILLTQATSLVHMMRLTLLSSSKSRVAFAGVAAFYRALHAQRNPFFYVSSSPWNLYEFLCDFMVCKDIVAGPLLLRDFGLDRTRFIAGPHKTHKLAQIKRVLECYPSLKFILIGDSGQHDPEIYAQCVKQYPGRILVIYIRDVSGGNERSGQDQDQEQQKRMEELSTDDVPLLLVRSTAEAAQHAARAGFILASTLEEINNETIVDEHLPYLPVTRVSRT